jgi:hypothetical protein
MQVKASILSGSTKVYCAYVTCLPIYERKQTSPVGPVPVLRGISAEVHSCVRQKELYSLIGPLSPG